MTVAAQVCLVILVSELFTEFYRHTHHGAERAVPLLRPRRARASWCPGSGRRWASPCSPTAILSVHGARRTAPLLYLACAMLFVGVLIDKGIGTIIPGFVPEPWGKIPRYSPTWVELTVTAGLWALGRLRVHGARQGRHPDRARPVAVARARGVTRMAIRWASG